MTTTVRNAADLVADLERRIAGGELLPGERLDPVRTAAADLGLAPNTVAGAYRELRNRGYTVSRGRAGTFIANRPALGGVIADVVPDGLVDLANGHPDPRLLPDLRDALGRVEYAPATYATHPVDPQLGRLLGDEFGADGVDASHLAVVGGALDGIERALQTHVRPGDGVAVEDPAYASVVDLLGAMGLRPVSVAIDDAGPLPDATQAALEGGCSALIVTPRAQNPTGAAIDSRRAAELGDVVQQHPHVLVVEDDHAGQVAGARHHPIVRPDRTRWAVVRSVSKSLGPDLRLAGLVGDAVTVNRIVGRQAAGTGWVSHLLQRLVVELRRSEAEALALAETTYRQRREALVAELRNRGIPASGRSGLNVWVPVTDETAVVTAMHQRGYAIRAGARFRIEAPPGVRVTVASSDQTQIRDVAAALADIVRPARPRRSA